MHLKIVDPEKLGLTSLLGFFLLGAAFVAGKFYNDHALVVVTREQLGVLCEISCALGGRPRP